MFAKFWRRTRDGLFLAFSAAFMLLRANQALLALSRVPLEERGMLYLIRLAAFLIMVKSIA